MKTINYLKDWGKSYPITGFDADGFFTINAPPPWVAYLESRGIKVRQGAWGILRPQVQND